MKSLFTRLQSYFKESFGGRYFSIIIRELAYEDPEIIDAVFGTKGFFSLKKHEVLVEFPFTVNDRNRIADLAVIEKESGRVLGIAEVKYDDHLKESNAAQIDDYIDYANLHNIAFVYIAQYFPPEEHCKLLDQNSARRVLFSELGRTLLLCNEKAQNSARNLLVNFLKDKGLMLQKIDPEGLRRLMVRLVGSPTGNGRIRGNFYMVEKIPETFSTLMGNINILNYSVANRFGKALSTPGVDLAVIQNVALPAGEIEKHTARNGKRGRVFIKGNLDIKHGGQLIVFAGSLIEKKTTECIYFEYGFIFEKNAEKTVGMKLFAEVRRWPELENRLMIT